MSDYFLSKVYDSLLRRKQPVVKSAFRTLSESYNLVYEQEEPQKVKDIPFDVNKYQEGSWTVEQRNLYLPGSAPVPPTSGVLSKYNPEAKMTGVGPGECAVASLVSGLTDFADCRKMISGQRESFDVSWPTGKDAKYKFEVKQASELTDVRIGTEGTNLGRDVAEVVKDVLNTLNEEYGMLVPEDKNKINQAVTNYISKEYGIKKSKENKEKFQSRLESYTEWSVDGFVNAITNKIGELPFGMIFNDRYYYPGSELTRKKYLQVSIYKLIQIIEQLKADRTEDEIKKDTETEEVVKDVFHKVYGKENIPTFSNFLDKEAHKVDRKITKQKIEITQEGGIDLSSFIKSIKKFNFSDKLKDLKGKLTDSKTVTGLFPGHITGLFVISINDWKYIPRDQMGDYVVITRITQSKPKIKLKGFKDMSASEDANI
jgi:hypothetical protein